MESSLSTGSNTSPASAQSNAEDQTKLLLK